MEPDVAPFVALVKTGDGRYTLAPGALTAAALDGVPSAAPPPDGGSLLASGSSARGLGLALRAAKELQPRPFPCASAAGGSRPLSPRDGGSSSASAPSAPAHLRHARGLVGQQPGRPLPGEAGQRAEAFEGRVREEPLIQSFSSPDLAALANAASAAASAASSAAPVVLPEARGRTSPRHPAELPAFGGTELPPSRGQERSTSEGPSQRLRGKLLDLGTSFAGLDRQVEDDLRRRRELERRRLGEVSVVLSKLEEALATEAEHRQQDEQALHELVDRLLEDMVSHVQGSIADRFGRLTSSVEALHERCGTVEQGVRQLRGEVPSKLTVESAKLQSRLREFSAEFHADCRQRLEQDAQLQRAIEESEASIEQRIEQEVALLERQVEALQELLDDFAAGEDSAEGQGRQATVREHIARLNEEIEAENRKRETADDEVVQAINAYATTLHRSLQTANS